MGCVVTKHNSLHPTETSNSISSSNINQDYTTDANLVTTNYTDELLSDGREASSSSSSSAHKRRNAYCNAINSNQLFVTDKPCVKCQLRNSTERLYYVQSLNGSRTLKTPAQQDDCMNDTWCIFALFLLFTIFIHFHRHPRLRQYRCSIDGDGST